MLKLKEEEMPLLTSLQQYRHEISSLPRLTREEEAELEHQARCELPGSRAGQQLVENCLNYVAAIAWRYTVYADHDEYLDIVSVGNAALVRYLEKSLLKDNPSAYLRAVAKWEIIHHMYYHSKLMRRQRSEKKIPRICYLHTLDELEDTHVSVC
jgi:DNA-directed RNA polymerase specialized sigma subunit